MDDPKNIPFISSSISHAEQCKLCSWSVWSARRPTFTFPVTPGGRWSVNWAPSPAHLWVLEPWGSFEQ